MWQKLQVFHPIFCAWSSHVHIGNSIPDTAEQKHSKFRNLKILRASKHDDNNSLWILKPNARCFRNNISQ